MRSPRPLQASRRPRPHLARHDDGTAPRSLRLVGRSLYGHGASGSPIPTSPGLPVRAIRCSHGWMLRYENGHHSPMRNSRTSSISFATGSSIRTLVPSGCGGSSQRAAERTRATRSAPHATVCRLLRPRSAVYARRTDRDAPPQLAWLNHSRTSTLPFPCHGRLDTRAA
jgi:hypothetical protein